MFGKLIKYEFRATRRIMLPFLAAVIVLSPLVGLGVKAADLKRFGSIITSVVDSAFAIAVIGVFIASFILMIRRFHASFLSDEGYLTFTLPARTSSLVFAKLLTSFTWFLAASLSCTIAGSIIGAINGYGSSFKTGWSFVSGLSKVIGGGNVALYCLEALICLFVFSSLICLHFYAAMALGYSFSKHKVLLSVCFYILLSIVTTFLSIEFFKLAANGKLLASLFERFGSRITELKTIEDYAGLAAIPHALSGMTALWLLIWAALYYVPTILPLKKRLNLN